MASSLTDRVRRLLVEEQRIAEEELKPLSSDEWSDLRARLCDRGVRLEDLAGAMPIDMSCLRFEKPFSIDGFVFPHFHSVAGFEASLSPTFQSSLFVRPFSANGITARGNLSFRHAIFRDWAHFDDMAVKQTGDFQLVTFAGAVTFERADFEYQADFDSATFEGDFTSFAGCRFAARADFKRASFTKSVPDFRDAVFCYASIFDGVKWPAPRAAGDGAREKFGWLRFAMNSVQRADAERSFFVEELRVQRHEDWRRRLAIEAYLLLSDGGRSVLRPLLVWCVAGLALLLALWSTLPLPWDYPQPPVIGEEAARFVLGSAFVVGSPALDLRRLRLHEEALSLAMNEPGFKIPAWLQVVQLIHAGVSALCLFLIVFAIRNWLRIR
jgi:hypothetical protein